MDQKLIIAEEMDHHDPDKILPDGSQRPTAGCGGSVHDPTADGYGSTDPTAMDMDQQMIHQLNIIRRISWNMING